MATELSGLWHTRLGKVNSSTGFYQSTLLVVAVHIT